MTDAQLAMILSAIGAGFAAMITALKWAVGRIVKSQDDASSAIVKAAEVSGALKATVESLIDAVERLRTDLGDDLRDVRDKVVRHLQTTPPPNKRATTVQGGVNRARTPGRGVPVRSRSQGDEEG